VQRIGLYGGSFDPIHIGHLLVGQAAIEELQLTQLIYIPAAQSPFKPESSPAPGAHRLAMCRLALAGRTDTAVDDLEIQRGGMSFTIDTVRAYVERFPQAKLFYLIGADNVVSLPKWRNATELAALIEFAVIPRPGQSQVPFPAPFVGQYLRGFPIEISSSEIRTRIKAGLSLTPLVPPAVDEFIRNNRLYL